MRYSTYEGLLLVDVLVVVVEPAVHLVILLPLRHVLDLLCSVIDGPGYKVIEIMTLLYDSGSSSGVGIRTVP